MVTKTKQEAKAETTAPVEEAKPKSTRRTLTPAERVAKLEAELKAAREKAAEKDSKKADALKERRGVLVQKINEQQAKLKDIDDELQLLGYTVVDGELNLTVAVDEV